MNKVWVILGGMILLQGCALPAATIVGITAGAGLVSVTTNAGDNVVRLGVDVYNDFKAIMANRPAPAATINPNPNPTPMP
jgi:hypothetical protein